MSAYKIRSIQFLLKKTIIVENTNSRGKQIWPQFSEVLFTTSWITLGKQVAKLS